MRVWYNENDRQMAGWLRELIAAGVLPDGDVDERDVQHVRWRPVEPGSFPLDYGLPSRVGRLRGYGNAIVPQVAALFVRAFMEAR